MVFTKEIRSEVEIEGTAEEVWSVLTDFDRYGEWNPGFSQVRGRAEVGATLDVTFLRSGDRTTKMHPRVLVAEPGREFRWLGRLLMPWVFDGEHRFEIHEDEPGRVRFVQAERFRGVLVPFFRHLIEVDTLTTFGEVNEALAARVVELRSTV
ncbi:MAG TPA: SRPBCC domain-containing protein [Actinomycetota bacterium]|nr:SRPBCC domain-containing protein [Actinomycetota bacterium]